MMSNLNQFVISAGRYCEWQHITVDKSSDIETFEDYKKTLKLECEPGEAAILNWTVSSDTPDLVYYQVEYDLSMRHRVLRHLYFQCYTHNNLGWKIHVVDPGTTSHRANFSVNLINSSMLVVLSALLTFHIRSFLL